MPEIGVSMDEGTLARWLKQPGDAVTAGEAIAEIETDKAAVELEAPPTACSGGTSSPKARPRSSARRSCACSRRARARTRRPRRRRGHTAAPAAATPSPAASATPAAAPAATVAAGRRPHRLTPRARRIAREHGIPYESVGGAGPRERRARPDRRAARRRQRRGRTVRRTRGRLSRPHRAQGQRGLDDDPPLRRDARDRLRRAARAGRLVQARGHGRHRHRPPARGPRARGRDAGGARPRSRPRGRHRRRRADPGRPRRRGPRARRARRRALRAPSSERARAG